MAMPPGPPIIGSDRPPTAPEDPDGGSRLFADESVNRRVVVVTLAVAIVAVVAMIAGYLLRPGSGGEDAVTDTVVDEAGAEPGPGAAPAPDGPLGAADLERLVADLSEFVEEERGLELRDEVDVEVLGEEAYLARVRADFEEGLDEGREDLESSTAALQALGLWPPGTDAEDVLAEFFAGGSLGFYDPEADELVVRGSADTPNLRTTLVHELTHALDDQHFDLDRPDLGDAPDESAVAFRAVVEGSAGRVESAYSATLTAEEREEARAEQLALVEDLDPTSFPPILFAQQAFVYTDGAAFVDALYDAGGNRAVDRALRRPPTTSEQILEPEAWPEREPVIEVPVPEADGRALDDGVAGQFLLHILTGLDTDGDPSPEWDGDNGVVWLDGDRACLRIALAGDIAAWERSLGPWAVQVDADLDVDGDLLVVTSCR